MGKILIPTLYSTELRCIAGQITYSSSLHMVRMSTSSPSKKSAPLSNPNRHFTSRWRSLRYEPGQLTHLPPSMCETHLNSSFFKSLSNPLSNPKINLGQQDNFSLTPITHIVPCSSAAFYQDQLNVIWNSQKIEHVQSQHPLGLAKSQTSLMQFSSILSRPSECNLKMRRR